MNQKGQAMVESVVVTLLVLALGIILMRMAFMTWANLVTERESHRLVVCTLRQQNAQACERESRRLLPKLLFGFMNVERVQAQVWQELGGTYSARSQILVTSKFGRLDCRRSLSEHDILLASRRWR